MYDVRPIFKIQPVQTDTVQLIPNCALRGKIGEPVDVVGDALAAKITLTRNANIPLTDGVYRVECVNTGTEQSPSLAFVVENLNTQTTSGSFAAGTANQGIIGGINLTISNTTGVAEGDYAEFEVTGDQTYIVPGTVLGRVKGTKNWKPAYDDEIDSFDEFRIAQTFQETDKSQTVLPHGYEFSVSQVFSIAVVVYGQLIESACRAINLTNNLKAKMPWYVWI